eukprot:PhF_6_TR4824/c4_g1_i8/m.6688
MQRRVLDEQKVSILVPIPKPKGDKSDPSNWRGIFCLIPHITKLFDRLILNRVRTAIDDHLHPSQNGFREGRGTNHHIMALSMVRDLATTRKDFPVHACFVDFSKAFDSVKWNTIATELKYWHCPPELITNIFDVMHDHRIRVRNDDALSDPFTVDTGVLQGDTLAPYLFIIVLDCVLRQLALEDGILLSKPTPKLTRRQAAAYVAPPEKRLNALAFAVVANYKYLGVELRLARRKSKTWSSLKSFNGIWTARVSFDAKRRLFQALVEPILVKSKRCEGILGAESIYQIKEVTHSKQTFSFRHQRMALDRITEDIRSHAPLCTGTPTSVPFTPKIPLRDRVWRHPNVVCPSFSPTIHFHRTRAKNTMKGDGSTPLLTYCFSTQTIRSANPRGTPLSTVCFTTQKSCTSNAEQEDMPPNRGIHPERRDRRTT